MPAVRRARRRFGAAASRARSTAIERVAAVPVTIAAPRSEAAAFVGICGYRHRSYPAPRIGELATALLRHPPIGWILAATSGTAILIASGFPWLAAATGAVLFAAWPLWRLARSGLVGRWRRDAVRRHALDQPPARDARRRALLVQIEAMRAAADAAWHAYLAEAMVGRVQSVLYDRPAPRLDAIEVLATIDAVAERFHIEWLRDATRLPPTTLEVPPERAFQADVLSPTFAALTAASLRHAKEEGSRRATRRFAAASAAAKRFAPLFATAAEASIALDGTADPTTPS